jgi:hypothetical protein
MIVVCGEGRVYGICLGHKMFEPECDLGPCLAWRWSIIIQVGLCLTTDFYLIPSDYRSNAKLTNKTRGLLSRDSRRGRIVKYWLIANLDRIWDSNEVSQRGRPYPGLDVTSAGDPPVPVTLAKTPALFIFNPLYVSTASHPIPDHLHSPSLHSYLTPFVSPINGFRSLTTILSHHLFVRRSGPHFSFHYQVRTLHFIYIIIFRIL